MTRLVFGTGKVAMHLVRDDTHLIPRKMCDITDIDRVSQILSELKPEIVINCAAKTNLEYCQDHRDDAYRVNTRGAVNVLQVCSDASIKFVQISSGCLFDGNDRVFDEESEPDPKVWYTWTKKWADEFIKEFGYENYLILRPRQMISAVPNPSNLLTKFLSKNYIPAIDEDNSITCIEDLSKMIDHLVDNDHVGIFNTCNSGYVSPYAIAMGVKKALKPSLHVEKVDYDYLLSILPNRRVNTLLSIDKLLRTGYTPRSGNDALNWCLENYAR
jgi:dTDP-4-dehydrorhamnose reductase